MDKSQHTNNKLEVEGGEQSAPVRKNFNINIEKVLLKAVTNRSFREKLLHDRKSALESQDIPLTTEDKIILEKIPSQMLHNMIENFLHQQSTRRDFLKGAAVTVALLTTSIVISSCNENSQNVTEPTTHPTTSDMKLSKNTPLPQNFGYPQYSPGQGLTIGH